MTDDEERSPMLMLMLMLVIVIVIAIESEMGDQGRKAETLKAKSHVCFARRRIPISFRQNPSRKE